MTSGCRSSLREYFRKSGTDLLEDHKRIDALTAILSYVINMTIGTPPKLASLQVDTGSTDLWFQTLNSATCQASDSSCANFTDYDVSKSSSAKLVGRNVSTLVYGLGNANCDQYNETVSFGNITFQNMPVRVAGQSKGLPFGIVGLGSSDYSTPAIVNNQRTTLPTFLQYMVQNKYIQSQAFSFWLNSSTCEYLQIRIDFCIRQVID